MLKNKSDNINTLTSSQLRFQYRVRMKFHDKTNHIYFGHPFNYSFYVLVANNHII